MAEDPERGSRLPAAAGQWLPSISMAAVSMILLVDGWPKRTSTLGAGALLVLAWLLSPWFFPRSQADATAREQASEADVPLIYWRAGCVYCLRLRLALGRTGNQAVWVDVSRDDDASARVRSVNDGNETVPTVFVGGSAWVNPAPSAVRSTLAT